MSLSMTGIFNFLAKLMTTFLVIPDKIFSVEGVISFPSIKAKKLEVVHSKNFFIFI
jgi:hypothetical protein